MPFVKGQSGNPRGRPPGKKALTTSLRARMEKAGERKKLEAALFDLAYGHQVRDFDKKGNERIYSQSPDFRAIQFIYERLEGKPAQALQLTGDEVGGAIRVALHWETQAADD